MGRPDPMGDRDLSVVENPDGGGGGGEDGGGGKEDGGGGGKGDMANMGTGLPCTPGSYRCGAGNAVEICNSSGSAWLFSQTCAVSCNAGLCTGACAPASRRCNAANVEECNGAGTAWSVVERCTTFCASAKCALNGLEVTMNRSLDGEVIVSGDVIVRSGVTLNSPKGDLTLRARSITVENGATISAAPTGNTAEGRGGNSGYYRYGGGGGSYGERGDSDASGSGGYGAVYGSDDDAPVQAGAKGGDCGDINGGKGGNGGGVLRLIAESNINVAGFVTANGTNGTGTSGSSYGGGGGGSGGGVLLAAGGDVTVAGTISAQGGAAGPGYYAGGKGGLGRVKLLAGGKRMIAGAVTGAKTEGILPPLQVASSSHPDPTLVYNDDFPSVELAWNRPFLSRQGYYHAMTRTQYQVPTPATGAFVNMELVTLPASSVRSGSNYFHLAAVDSMSNVGTVETSFQVQINSAAPTVSSMSHPNPSTWSANKSPFFQWSFPTAERNYKGAYYVFDHYGDTVPSKAAATFIPVTQKQQLISDVAPGLWVMHVVTVDQRDYLTKQAGHYRVSIGDDPGTGVVLGQIVDMGNKPVEGATVTVNRGLFTTTTNSTGNFNLPAVVAGSWELRVSKSGFMTGTKAVDVTKGGSTTVNLTLN